MDGDLPARDVAYQPVAIWELPPLHLGVEVETTAEVDAAATRLSELGLFTAVENDTTCCYAVQDKVWVHGPGAEPWEVYTVKADAPDATSIHPVGQPDSSSCECGTPTSSSGVPLAISCC